MSVSGRAVLRLPIIRKIHGTITVLGREETLGKEVRIPGSGEACFRQNRRGFKRALVYFFVGSSDGFS